MVKSQFDLLVESISSSERKDMLTKIEETFSVSDELLSVPQKETDEAEVDPFEYYSKADVITRLFVILISFFTGKDKSQVVLDTFLNRIKRQITRDYPLLFHMEKEIALPGFYNLILNFEEALNVFKEPVIQSMDFKDDFSVFFTNRMIGDFEKEILDGTNPYLVEESHPDYSLNQIHRYIDSVYDTKINEVDMATQKRLIVAAGIMNQLHKLVLFDYTRITSCFSTTVDGKIDTCSLKRIRQPLQEINEILFSFQIPPDIILLEALFLFSHRELLTLGTMNDLEGTLQNEIGKSVESLNGIRNFNRITPLTSVLKVLNGNIDYMPVKEVVEGKFFWHYKHYLQRIITNRFNNYINTKKKKDILSGLSSTWGISYIEPLVGFQGSAFSSDLHFTYESSLSILNSFVGKILVGKFHTPLNMIYINGDFYRRDNRAEFSEIYDRLENLPGQIREFAVSFLKEGFYYNSFTKFKEEGVPLDPENDEVRKLLEGIDRASSDLLTKSLDIFSTLSSLLKGILMGSGGVYDTLSNYSELGGSRNRDFKDEIISLEFLVSSTHTALLEISSLELKSSSLN